MILELIGVEGIYTALGLLKGCKTDAAKGVETCAAGEGMGLSAAGGIFLNREKKKKKEHFIYIKNPIQTMPIGNDFWEGKTLLGLGRTNLLKKANLVNSNFDSCLPITYFNTHSSKSALHSATA